MSRLHRQKIRSQRHEREADAAIASAEKQTLPVESVSTAPAGELPIKPSRKRATRRSAGGTRSKAKRR